MWSDPFPLYAKLNPDCSQILHMRSTLKTVQTLHYVLDSWRICKRNFKIFNLNFWRLPLKPFWFPWLDNPRSSTISTTQYMGDTCRMDSKGQGHTGPKSSDQLVFTAAINTPSLPPAQVTPHSHLSRAPDLAPPLTSSSPEWKSFAASTSPSAYSHQPRKSSLCCCCSCLPLPS